MNSAWKSPVFYIIIAALVIRLVYLLAAFPDAGQESALSIDELYHYNWASAIADGDVLTNAPYFRAPLYPFFLALLIKISSSSLLFIRLFHLLLGLVTIWLTFRIGSILFSRLTGIIAAALFAFYPIITYFDSQLLLDSLFTLLAISSLYCLIDSEEKPATYLLAGLFFGLAAITRPTILVFLPIIIFILWRRYSRDGKVSLRGLIGFILILILCIAPVTIINYATSGQLTLISYQGGVNFYIGNNPEADGLYSEFPGYGADWTIDDVDYQTHVEAGEPLRYSAQSWFWMTKGFRFISNHPIHFMELFGKKLFFFFSGNEISNNRRLDISVFSNIMLKFLPVRFWLILSLAVFALCLPETQKKNIWSLALIILIYALTISFFFIAARFRLPIIPLLAILGAVGVGDIIKITKRREFGHRLFFALIISIGAGVFTHSNIYSNVQTDPRQTLYIAGNGALRAGDYRTAITYYDSINTLPGYYRDTNNNRGLAYLKLGDTKNSLASFYAELKANPQSADAMNNLAAVYLVNGQIDSARIYASSALSLQPYNKEAAINMLRAAVADTTGREAIETQRQDIRQYVDQYPSYLFEEALYFASLSRVSEAIDDQLRVQELLENSKESITFKTAPFSSLAKSRERLRVLSDYQLGYLYGLSGRYETSIKYSHDAIAADSLLKQAYINLISGYRSLGRDREADSVVARYLTIWPG